MYLVGARDRETHRMVATQFLRRFDANLVEFSGAGLPFFEDLQESVAAAETERDGRCDIPYVGLESEVGRSLRT